MNPVEPDNPDNRTRKTVNPLGLLHNVVREFVKLFKSLEEKEVVKNMPVSQTSLDLKPITDSIDKELVCVCVLIYTLSIIKNLFTIRAQLPRNCWRRGVNF